MSVTTEYKCDLCGTVQVDDKQFWVLALYLRSYSWAAGKELGDRRMEVDACRVCVEKRGLLPINTGLKPHEVAAPTMDDFIRDIVREEIQNNMSPVQ